MKNPLCLQDELTFELILDSKRTSCLSRWYRIWWSCVRKFLPSHEWISPVMAGISYLSLRRAVLYFLVYPVFWGPRAFNISIYVSYRPSFWSVFLFLLSLPITVQFVHWPPLHPSRWRQECRCSGHLSTSLPSQRSIALIAGTAWAFSFNHSDVFSDVK